MDEFSFSSVVSRSFLAGRPGIWGLLLAAGWCGLSAAASPEEGARQLILLRSGAVMEGLSQKEGDHFVIEHDLGTTRLRSYLVQHVASSWQEIYEAKRATNIGDAGHHRDVADWCLRHGLAAQAALELIDARRLDASHPRLELLERRLAQHLEAESGKTTAPQRLEHSALSVNNKTEQLPTKSPAEISSVSFQTFSTVIQPILLNRCSNGGCHGTGGSAQLVLNRAALYGSGHRRGTLENLQAVLVWIDRHHPGQSRLLRQAVRPHGGAAKAPFPPRSDRQLEHLVNWVKSLETTTSHDSTPPKARNNATFSPSNYATPSGQGSGIDTAEWDALLPPTIGPRSVSATADKSHPPTARPTRAAVAQPANRTNAHRYAPSRNQDPFDPDEFNRKYSPRWEDDQEESYE